MDASTIPSPPSTGRSPEALPRDARIPWEFFMLAVTGDLEVDPLRDVFPVRPYDCQ
jgi:hypothetical protein